MTRNILWNGFEIKKGTIETSVGNIPYISYSPLRSNEPINVAIHGEGDEKEEWLCFNSTSKLGNLLKESIKNNSPFIAFDLYGHGEWINEENYLNIEKLSESNITEVVSTTIKGINEALPIIINQETFISNKLIVTGYHLGCSVALGIKLDQGINKIILLSPNRTETDTLCKNFIIFRGKNDKNMSDDDFNTLLGKLPFDTDINYYKSDKQIPESWINKAKEFIYN